MSGLSGLLFPLRAYRRAGLRVQADGVSDASRVSLCVSACVRESARWAKPGAAAARTSPIVFDRDYSEPVVSAGVGGFGGAGKELACQGC